MKTKFIIINGVSTAGKNLFVELFNKITEHSALNLTTISPVEAAMDSLDIKKTRDNKWRKCAAELKEVTDRHYDISFNYIIKKVKSLGENSFHKFVFIHCREPKNIEGLKNHLEDLLNKDVITLFINRDVDNIPDNKADMGVFDYIYDYEVNNNGDKGSLKNQASWLLSELGGE